MSDPPAIPETPEAPEKDAPERRYTYRYRLLADEGGGVYITDAFSVELAYEELLMVYAARLDTVERA